MDKEHAHCHIKSNESEKIATPSYFNKIVDSFKQYLPLVIILLFSFLLSVSHQLGLKAHYHSSMSLFMGYFFIFLALFKFFDIPGFVSNFLNYDFISQRYPSYAYFYPSIELILGLGFISGFFPILMNIFTIVVMGFTAVGIIQTLFAGKELNCACLGSVIKLPLGTISVIETIFMSLMALFNLYALLIH